MVTELQGCANPAAFLSYLPVSRADYTKSVIDLRPEDFVGEGSTLGDRSKSVPGLNTELVRPSVVMVLAEEWSWLHCSCARASLLLPMQTVSLSLQDEEEEDIDNLVEIHRQRVARGSMRSGTSSVSPVAWLCPVKWGSSQLFPRELAS